MKALVDENAVNAADLTALINELQQQVRLFTHYCVHCIECYRGWLGSRVVSVLDSGTEGPGFKSQSRRCRITVLGKLFTPIVPLFTKQQQNW